jgi:hypothetical protein
MNEPIKKILGKMDGYKTVAMMAALLALRGVKLIWPDLMSVDLYTWIQDALLLLGGGAGADNLRKRLTSKK